MNSDHHDSTAWHAFGMLDADESARLEEASRHDPALLAATREVDSLVAAIAAVSVKPLQPKPGQIEKLHRRLGLSPKPRINWAAISGWAAAAVLAMMFMMQRSSVGFSTQQITQASSPQEIPTAPVTQAITARAPSGDSFTLPHLIPATEAPSASETEVRTIAKVETKRLIQEIEILREKLETAQKRDRRRFDVVRGMAWPIVIAMNPPLAAGNEVSLPSLEMPPPSVTSLLADALTASASSAERSGIPVASSPAPSTSATAAAEMPSAIPIYDAARDTGTLFVNELPAASEGEDYFLWVKTEGDDKPINVGRLPKEMTSSRDSFDFNLGSTGIVPTGFFLTKGASGDAAAPSAENIVLEGPN